MGKRRAAHGVSFPLPALRGCFRASHVVSDETLKTEFEEALERHSPSAIVAGVALGHSMCEFGFIHSKHGIFRTLIPTEVLVNEFFETRGFDFLVFVISLFLSRSRTNLTIDGITMSVPCPVTYTEEKLQLHTHWSGWPEDPVYELRQRLGIEKITIFNDAVAFALGCLLEPQAKEFPFPILCLTLGSGIGCALLQEGINGLKTVPFELVQIRKWWPVGPTGFEGDPHELAGAPFFSYARHYTDWDVEETRRQFSLRITLIIQELEGKFEFNWVLLGGVGSIL